MTRKKFLFKIYTQVSLTHISAMKEMWELLNVSQINPKKYGVVERAKHIFENDSFTHANSLFLNVGTLFVRGSKDGFLAYLTEWPNDLGIWHFYINEKAIKQDHWVDWFLKLCSKLPILFGCACSINEYEAKHQLIQNLGGGKRIVKTSGVSLLDFRNFLPGIYWLTVFGIELTKRFQQLGRLSRLPNSLTSITQISPNQIALKLNAPALPDDLPTRLKEESQIVEILGENFFFRKLHADKSSQLQLQNPLYISSTENLAIQQTPSSGTQQHPSFSNVILPDNLHLRELAENLIIYIHKETSDEIYQFLPASLQIIDEYLLLNNQLLGFSDDHLLEEFIPALGAYLGIVIIERLAGTLKILTNQIDSGVEVNKQLIPIFKIAYQAVYHNVRVMKVYNMVAKGEAINNYLSGL